MKRKLLSFILLICICLFLPGCKGCSGCNKDDDSSENGGANANVPLVLSSQELDGVFNPFFSTTAPDSQIVGMTQIGMLGNDSKGQVTYGVDEGVVVLDLETIYDKTEDTTTYFLVLKNNIKFSNGSPLTMKDVLFNLYVYLDPVYTGSSTIYSTDIVGLKEYRTQQSYEEEQDSFMEQFQDAADDRIINLLTVAQEIYDENKNETLSIEDFKLYLEDYLYEDIYENIVTDFEKACELFKEELNTDYDASGDGACDSVVFTDSNGTKHPGLFTKDVEMFLYNEGYITWNSEEARLETSLGNDPNELKYWSREKAIDAVYNDKMPMSLAEVILLWQNTSVKFNEYLVNEALADYHKNNERSYTNISGIQFINKEQPIEVNGKTYVKPTYNEDGSVANDTNEVLAITINGVDPKAIWNFAFTVAPMYYYSSEKLINAFDYESNFGVEYASQDFMNNVIKNPDKIGIPVGAGPYQACDSSHSTENLRAGDFKSNNVVYFVRNEYYLLGAPEIKYLHYQVVASNNLLNALYNGEVDYIQPNSNPETIAKLEAKKGDGIENTPISTSGYGYIGINAGFVPDIEVRQAIMHAINTQLTVSYYGNTASAIHRSMSLNSWAYPDGATAYYPYIGGEIPDDLTVVNPYYAEFVNEKGKKTGEKFTIDEQKEFIINLVESAGYVVGGDGIYVNDNSKLKYTFTIAGADKEHPAYNAFHQAANLLNQINFDITVSTDAQALSKLATGGLQVWAAAWSSTIDPDMYQVYHKDSTASSTLNWGYKQILQNVGDKYDYELELIELLSEYIEDGRETDDQELRAQIYADALNIVMELAIELPTYQRNDLFAYNVNKIDKSSLNSDLSPYSGLLADIHTVRFNKEQ